MPPRATWLLRRSTQHLGSRQPLGLRAHTDRAGWHRDRGNYQAPWQGLEGATDRAWIGCSWREGSPLADGAGVSAISGLAVGDPRWAGARDLNPRFTVPNSTKFRPPIPFSRVLNSIGRAADANWTCFELSPGPGLLHELLHGNCVEPGRVP